MKTIWIFLFRLLLVLSLSLLLASSVFLLSYTYEAFTYSIFEQFGQLDKLEKFRAVLLTRERFAMLRLLSLAGTVAGSLFIFFIWKHIPALGVWWNKIVVYTGHLFSGMVKFWKAIPFFEKAAFSILLLSVIVSRLYFLLRFPFHIDERFSYLYFVSKGIGVSLAYYPNPNNHILYTLFCNVARLLVHEPVLVMKLPSLLFGICLTVLYWALARCYFGAVTGLLASTLFSFSEYVFYYGMQGRGYTLLLLFTLIATVSALKIVNERPIRLPAYGWFWLSSVLGFYSIPIFLYPFSGIVVFAAIYLFRQKAFQKIQWLATCLLLITVSVCVLYLPVFLFNGLSAISGNSWVAPLPWESFITAYPANLLDLNANLWGTIPLGQWLTGIVVMSCMILIVNKNERLPVRQWCMLLLISLLLNLTISFLQRILLYQRVLIYLSVFMYPVLAVLTVKISCLFLKNLRVRLLMACCLSLLVAGINIFAFYKYTSSEDFDLYDSFDTTADLLYDKNADNIFVNCYEYSLCIRFKYETSGKIVNMDTNEPIPDTAYRFLVIHNSRPLPSQFSGQTFNTLYKDAEVTIYERQ